MNLTICLEHRFDRTPDGAVWTQVAYAASFWARYLAVFRQVDVVARLRDVASVPADWVRADTEAVRFVAIPHYLGPWQYLIRARQVNQAARTAVIPGHAVILRVPSAISASLEHALLERKQPFGVEVVGDPHDVFAPGAIQHRLRPFFRWWFARTLRRQCARACAAAYVTAHALQRRYPPAPGAWATHYSSIELPTSAIRSAPRPIREAQSLCTLITVGSLAQLYKAPDVLLDAVAMCVRDGLDLALVVIGDGKYRSDLEAHARALGIADRVSFLGQLPAGDAVRAQLDQADVFVLPSRTEGLPRAMIEAMARGLPCIGSTVGGIPELLPPEDLVPPGDRAALARTIGEVVRDPARMGRMSARNLEHAQAYQEEVLQARRAAFYRHVREQTEAWLTRRGWA